MINEIITKNLLIRPLTAADGDAVVPILNLLEVSRWLVPIPHPFTHSDLRLTDDDGTPRWPSLAAITFQGRLIGGIGMGARLGYYLHPDFWGRGFAKEAATAAVNASFKEFENNEIESGYFVGNAASGRILNGLGFQEIERKDIHCKALNAARASIEMKLTKADWQAR